METEAHRGSLEDSYYEIIEGLAQAGQCEHCVSASSLSLHNDNNSLIIPTSQMSRLRPGELEHLAQSQQAFQPRCY